MSTLFDRLYPRPRSARFGAGVWRVPQEGRVLFAGTEEALAPARGRLLRGLGPRWREAAEPAPDVWLRLQIVPGFAKAQSYRLSVSEQGVVAEAGDRGGLFYAAVTLAHLLRLSGGLLPVCQIEDSPDFPDRGLMLDVSRDKVPTMPTLLELVDRLADLKYNQLQLYTEHTFAYPGHEEVWRNASPMTGDEVRELDAHCRSRCVELVPNQNSFGHLERWLTLPRYKPLAELPQGGAPLPWGGVHERPTTLCPTDPRCLDFLAGLFDALLPHFTSRRMNIGCDETFDLRGAGRSRALVARAGEGRVYLDFLLSVHRLVTARGRTPMFWGDIIIRHPELVGELPPDSVALEWGYEADHPFDAHGAKFAGAGVPFYVCPGTSSWNSLAGRTGNMVENLRRAAESGLQHGACGYLLTDWGDGGHWQPLAVSLPAIAYAACLAWCQAANRRVDPAEAADAHVTEGLGRALLSLGEVYRLCGAERGNGSELFHILSKPASRPLLHGVTPATLSAVLGRVNEIEAALPSGVSVLDQEARQVVRLLRASCRRGIALLEGRLVDPAERVGLADEMAALIAGHQRVWRLRNREGGLSDSVARLAQIRSEYLGPGCRESEGT